MANEKVNIAGLDKAEVLAALHNGTRAAGMGVLHDIQRDMTAEEARPFLDSGHDSRRMFGHVGTSQPKLYFDYLMGRPLKVDITGDEFNPRLYDRDAGEGAAQRAIDGIREKAAVPSLSRDHQDGAR